MEKQKQTKGSDDTKRVTRKRPVLKEQNLPSDDSDFEEEKTNYRKAPSPVKSSRTKTKTANNAKMKMKSKKGKESDRVKEAQQQQQVELRKVKKRNMNNNLVSLLGGYSSGLVSRSLLTAAAVRPVMENVARLGVAQLVTPFDRRVTAIAWHPTNPHLAVAGSKGGDIILWDTNQNNYQTEGKKTLFQSMIQGRGPGGSIQCLKFDSLCQDRVYTASIDGTVMRHDFSGADNKIYLETGDWERWYTGLDVSFSTRTMVAGNNKGVVTLLSLEGEKIWDKKLHKAKCNFVQFSERQSWMMVTTSTGAGTGSVKVWDIRNIKGRGSALAELHHDKAVNSAYFSPQSGDKLLTTDQHSQLRVYQAPHFSLVKTIPHPHRQFQHLTPIKACWHPLADIVFAGRYPDPNFPNYHAGELRTIDFFCPDTGKLLHGLHQPGLSQIISLSQFNCAGDKMISGMASTVMVWQPRQPFEEEEDQVPRQEGSSHITQVGGLTVQQWPDFTVKKKQAKKVKSKGEK